MDATIKKHGLAIKLEAIRQKGLLNGVLTYEDPLRYRGYLIHHNDIGFGGKYSFVHEGYDGPGDNRLGTEQSIEDCIREINAQIEDGIDADAVMVRVNGGEEIELSEFIAANSADDLFLDSDDNNRLTSLEVGEQCRVVNWRGEKKFIRRTR